MKLFFLALTMLTVGSVKATNYYFSASGDDSRTNVQAQNPSTPWKTLAKLNSYFSSLLPGDSVLFKRGESWYGTITINKSGTTGLPIVLSAFGSGSNPVITGLTTLTSWTSVGSGIYECPLISRPNTVVINGVPHEMGRYPNADAANKGYLIYETYNGNLSITDNELTSTTNWTGAEVVLRKERWVIDRGLITNHSGTTISYSGTSSYSPKNSFGYFIQNDIKTLDQFGEWCYNSATGKINVFFGSALPASATVKASTINNIINLSGISNVVIDNLTIDGGNNNGINVSGGANFKVKNCDVINTGVNAFYYSGTNAATIESCNILNSQNNGIWLYSGNTAAVIRGNTIRNTYLYAGMGQNGDAAGNAFNGNADGTVIEKNNIIRTGYIGILFNGNNVTVQNNYVDSFCFVKDDGGGIYTYTGAGNAAYTNRKVYSNIVLNGLGAIEGTDVVNGTSLSNGIGGVNATNGIYLDANTSGVDVFNNTVSRNTTNGIFAGDAHDNIIRSNTLFDNNESQLTISSMGASTLPRGYVIKNNIIAGKLLTQNGMLLATSRDDIKLFGNIDSNYYTRPLENGTVIHNKFKTSKGILESHFDIPKWKSLSGMDPNSVNGTQKIVPYVINSFTSANKFANGAFTSGITGASPVTGNGNAISSWQNAGQLDGGYLQLSFNPTTGTSPRTLINMGVGSISSAKNYVLKFSSKANEDSISIGAYLVNSSTFARCSPTHFRKLTSSRNENEILFSFPSTCATTNLVIEVLNQGLTMWLDNVQLYEADVIIKNPDDSIRFEYNSTSINKTIALDTKYLDIQNNKYSGSVSLLPYSSILLFKDPSASPVTNVPPTVNLTSPLANATFTAPAIITVAANAADTDGTISKVDFYNGSTFIGTAVSSPYTFNWSNVAKGSYSITAKATDNSGAVTISAPVTVVVNDPIIIAPTVSISSPVNNASYLAPAAVNITAVAADGDGTISKVDFYNGSTLIGTAVSSPYTFTWSNVAKGSYSITAKATDNSGAVTTSAPVTITVADPTIAPTVSISSPANNATYTAPAAVSITAVAGDADGMVSKVDFYNGSTLIGTAVSSPYTFTWNNVAQGNYSITAKATDNSGAVTTSAPVAISVTDTVSAPAAAVFSFLSFSGTLAYPAINLSWSTTNAPNTSHFSILWSTNGASFKTIGQVNYQSSTSSTVNYSFSHLTPNKGNNYYKIKRVDNTGKTVYSNRINISGSVSAARSAGALYDAASLLADDGSLSMKIGPNPATNVLSVFIHGAQAGKQMKLSILSVNGNELQSMYPNSVNPIQVNIASLPGGMYVVKVVNGDLTLVQKFVKL